MRNKTPNKAKGNHRKKVTLRREGGIMRLGGGLPEVEFPNGIYFPDDYLKTLGGPDGMRYITIVDFCMEPTICHGDMALADLKRKDVDFDGGIYIIEIDGQSFIKRLRRNPVSLELVVTWDNPNHIMPPIDPAKVKIIGLVVWFGRKLKQTCTPTRMPTCTPKGGRFISFPAYEPNDPRLLEWLQPNGGAQ